MKSMLTFQDFDIPHISGDEKDRETNYEDWAFKVNFLAGRVSKFSKCNGTV